MNFVKSSTDVSANNLDHVIADATSAALTVHLPSAGHGCRVTVIKVDSSAHAVTVAPAAGIVSTVNNATSLDLTTQHETRTFVCDGSNWWTA